MPAKAQEIAELTREAEDGYFGRKERDELGEDLRKDIKEREKVLAALLEEDDRIKRSFGNLRGP